MKYEVYSTGVLSTQSPSLSPCHISRLLIRLRIGKDSIEFDFREAGKIKKIATCKHAQNLVKNINKNKDYQKDLNYLSQAYALAQETNNATGLFHAGQRYGQIVHAMSKKEEGLTILKTAYQIGVKAGFPNLEHLENIIKQLENS